MDNQKKMTVTLFKVKEMDCPSEENIIRMKLAELGDDIASLDFDLSRPIFGTNITRQVLNWAISPSKTKMRIVINLMSLVIKPRSSIPLKSIPVC